MANFFEEIRNNATLHNFAGLAKLLSLPPPVNCPLPPSPPPTASIPPPYDAIAESHWKLLSLLDRLSLPEKAGADTAKALYSHANATLQLFLRAFTATEGNNEIAVLKALCRNLYVIAIQADSILKHNNQPADRMEDAARQLSRCFTITITDRAPLGASKKWSTLAVTGLLFRAYYRLGTIRLCNNIVRALDATLQAEFPPLKAFPKSEFVTFQYYRARLAINQNQFRQAEEYLTAALAVCRRADTVQRRELLVYLIVVKMIHGRLPQKQLLLQFDLAESFENLARALKSGDLCLFDATLAANQAFYMKKELFLVIQLHLRNLILRSFFKKIYLLCLVNGWSPEHRLNLRLVEESLRVIGVTDIDLDEVECMTANLIHLGFIRGYISHEKSMVVLSKKSPFPPPHKIL